jgi:hypothetical protein
MEEQTGDVDALLEKVDVPSNLPEEETLGFVETALDAIRGNLRSNLREARQMTDRFDESDDVDGVLAPENAREISVRAKPFENPRVTVWLNDAPIWANDAWRETIFPHGVSAYNGKVETTLDTRQF